MLIFFSFALSTRKSQFVLTGGARQHKILTLQTWILRASSTNNIFVLNVISYQRKICCDHKKCDAPCFCDDSSLSIVTKLMNRIFRYHQLDPLYALLVPCIAFHCVWNLSICQSLRPRILNQAGWKELWNHLLSTLLESFVLNVGHRPCREVVTGTPRRDASYW